MSDRLLPHDREAEVGVLGAVLHQNENLELAAAILTPEMFFSPAHSRVFATMLALRAEGVAIDELTLKNRMGASAGIGLAELVDLVDGTPVSANVEIYARIVFEKHQAREVIRVCAEISQKGREASENIEGIVRYGRDAFERLHSQETAKLRPSHIGAAVATFSDWMADAKIPAFVARTHTKLDARLGGLNADRPTVIAARTGVGKTTFALQTALRNAKAGIPSLFLSLELSERVLAGRALSALTGVPGDQLLHKKLQDITEDGWNRMEAEAAKLPALPLYLLRPSRAISVPEVESLTRRMMRENDIQFLVIDHLVRLKAPPGTLYEQQTHRCYEIARMVTALGIPVLVAVQINRGGEDKPSLANLEGSGAIEQTAAAVIILHDPDPDGEDGHEIEAFIAKNDSGRLGVTKLRNMAWKFTIE